VQALPTEPIEDAAKRRSWQIRRVPAPAPRPAFLAQARLRRTSPISHYAVAAALEALGDDAAAVTAGTKRLGVIFCAMAGCVNYSRRFYDEALRDPATASPLVFPETVFNAPSSHLSALLGAAGINYTLIGDPGTFITGLALAAQWLETDQVDGCVVIGAEERDWLTSSAFALFHPDVVLSEGAGALYLTKDNENVRAQLNAITSPHLYTRKTPPPLAAQRMCKELPAGRNDELLCDGLLGVPRADAAELNAWTDWLGARLSLKTVFGEGLAAASAWQCVAAIAALQNQEFAAATVSVVGCNEQAIGARFVR
jgi:3-oxoacyl-(acyl-carrier-protein) synthase